MKNGNPLLDEQEGAGQRGLSGEKHSPSHAASSWGKLEIFEISTFSSLVNEPLNTI
jgi:hypothetical protein